MTEIVEAAKLQQIINKIETIEQKRLENADLLKDALAEDDSLIELYRGALNI